MKRKIEYFVFILFLIVGSQLRTQAINVDYTVTFHHTIINKESFEWVVQKYEVIERPSPEAYTFFKADDVIKIEVVGEPPIDIENWSFTPDANFTGWLKFYKNNVVFNISETEYLPNIFIYGFIYPITAVNSEEISYFEYYAEQTQNLMDMSLIGGYSYKLSKDYFKVTIDRTTKKYVHSNYYHRIYNIHTGILSEYVVEFDNYVNISYNIEIVNPEDVKASSTIVVPIVTLLAIVLACVKKRRKNK